MKNRQIITIAGKPGSGKSTTAKMVAEKLGFKHFSSGDLFRKLGRERGVDVLQTNLSAEENAEVDYIVDGQLRDIGKKEDRLVIDSRTAWHWIPTSYKVFLDLDLQTGAERILSSMTEERKISEHIPADPRTYSQTLQNRLDSENRRYASLYQINPYDKNNYDLVIDTAKNNAQEVVGLVLQGFESWQKQP